MKKKNGSVGYVTRIAKVAMIGKNTVRVTLELRPSKRGHASDADIKKGLQAVARSQMIALKNLDRLL